MDLNNPVACLKDNIILLQVGSWKYNSNNAPAMEESSVPAGPSSVIWL